MSLHQKTIIHHENLYIVALTKTPKRPYILFLHGGPGLNSGVLEHLITHEGIFDALEFNVILYDQRACGRSKKIEKQVLHADNVHDLDAVYKIITKNTDYKIVAIAGHSYGAKVLFDYLRDSQLKIPSIFIATASSMLTPRINNILIDLAYLKSIEPEKYQKILEEFDNYDADTLWRVTEKLATVFQENKLRQNFYWANLIWRDKVVKMQQKVGFPINLEVFQSVRQDIYSTSENFSIEIQEKLKTPYLWINGFHDLIMEGASELKKNNVSVRLFFKSAHYPHIEENEKFCKEVNRFMLNKEKEK